MTAQWFAARGAADADWAVSDLAGGAMAQRLERIAAGELAVIRKWAPATEIAALRLAQSVRPGARAVPELIETGVDAYGTWFVIPEYRGSPSATLTPAAIDSLARLHAHFYGGAAYDNGIPVIDRAWWQALCTDWVQPALERHALRHGVDVAGHAHDVVESCRTEEALTELLSRITPTLLHGDIHPGNVLTDDEQTHLIDWGSSRFGTPLLDLLNLVSPDSPQLRAYLDVFAQHGSGPLVPEEIAAGIRWAAVQIPLQYLPWTLENRTTAEVTSMVAALEQALSDASR